MEDNIDIMAPDFIYPHREIIIEDQLDMKVFAPISHPYHSVHLAYIKLENDIAKKGETVTKEDKERLVMRSITLQSAIQEFVDKDLPEATDELINQIEKENMEKEQQEKFDAAMATAKQLHEAKDYAGAKAAYQEAFKINPEANECTDAIVAIDAEIAQADKSKQDAEELAEKATKDENFNSLIKTGDEMFAAKKYKEAKAAYTDAEKIYSNEITAAKLTAVEEADKAATPEVKTPKASPKSNAVDDALSEVGLEW